MNGFEHPSPSYWFLKAESPYHTLFFFLVSFFFKLSESSQKKKQPARTVKLKQNTRTKRNKKQRIENEEGKQSKNGWIKELLSNILFHEWWTSG